MNTLSDRMKQSRKALGLSQKDLARDCGVSQPTIAHWERGDHAPRAEALQRLAQCLKQDPVWLLSGELPAPQNPANLHLARPIIHIPVYDWPAHIDDIRTQPPKSYFSLSTHMQRAYALIETGQTGFADGTVLIFDPDRTAHPGLHLVETSEGLTITRNPKGKRLARLSQSLATH